MATVPPVREALFSWEDILVVIPAWNEELSIGQVVRRIRTLYPFAVAVIDDGSTDQTAVIAREAGAVVLPLAVHLETFAAIQTGFCYAQKNGFQVVVTMDADGQHFPEYIPELIAPVQMGQADMVIGVNPQRASRMRKLVWSFFSLLSGFPFEDLTSGFKALNREAVALLLTSKAQVFNHQDLGPLFLLQEKGLRIAEVPVPMQPRQTGKSRIFSNWGQVFQYVSATTLLCLSKMKLSGLFRNGKRRS